MIWLIKLFKYSKWNGLLMTENFINKYQKTWESRSSIRTRARKFIDFDQKGYFFPEEKQPLLLDMEIDGLGDEVRQVILLQSFRKYLNDIVNLEIKLISKVCNMLITGNLVIEYPEETKLNAYTILIDEYYHAYIAQDIIIQLVTRYPNLAMISYPTSDAYSAINLVKNQLDSKYHDIFEILAVCIFETTLVRELIEFFNSKNVHPSVRHYINDHMNDEAKHFSFFNELLCYTWSQLPHEYQNEIGSHMAHFIKNYLNINSEKEFNLNLLSSLIDSPSKAEKIVSRLYQGFEIDLEIPMVKNVISVLRNSNVLKNLHVKSGFQKLGWIV
jgi:hypothetical protein